MILKLVCLIILHENKQCKSEGFDSCDQPSNLTQIWFKSLIFQPNLRGKTSAVGDFLEAIRHIRQNYV